MEKFFVTAQVIFCVLLAVPLLIACLLLFFIWLIFVAPWFIIIGAAA